MNHSAYQSDPDRAPDSEFVPGELSHLVAGNHGRLLDARRTPVRITRVLPAAGFFEVQINAFEDAGARWLIALESVTSYQFAAGGAVATGAALDDLRDAVARCDVQISVAGGPAARERTEGLLRAERARAAGWLDDHGAPPRFDPLPFIQNAACRPAACGWLTGTWPAATSPT